MVEDLRGGGRFEKAMGLGAAEVGDGGLHAGPLTRVQRRVTMCGSAPAQLPAPSPRLTGVADVSQLHTIRSRPLPPKLLTKYGAERREGVDPTPPPTGAAAVTPADDGAGGPANNGGSRGDGSGDGVFYDDQVAPTPRERRPSEVLSASVSAAMGAVPPSEYLNRSQQAPRRHPRVSA
jgi:hypothetical protein